MTEEKYMTKLEILIVEDNEEFIANAVNTLSKEYNLRLAFDLEGAMEKLKENRTDYIITDLCFHEKGLNKLMWENLITPIMKSEDYIETLNRSKIELLEDGQLPNGMCVKRTHYTPINDNNKIKELLEIFNLNKDNLKKVTKAISDDLGWEVSETECAEETESRYRMTPPMGYYIIKKAQKEDIPFVVVTGWAHGEYFLPILAATGIETLDNLFFYRNSKILNQNGDFVGFVMPNKKVIIGDKKNSEVYKKAIKIMTNEKKK